MDGGPAAEKTLQKTFERMTKIAEIKGRDERNSFKGEISSVVPDRGEIEIDASGQRDPEEGGRRALEDREKTGRLESIYEALFREGGFEILRELETEMIHDPSEMGSLAYSTTCQRMDELGLLEENELTETGSRLYRNWKRFEEYLSSPERLEEIENNIGEMEMPAFLRASGIEVADADSYLRNSQSFQNRWVNQHDETVELYMITDVLHSDGKNDGAALRLLEDVREGRVDHPEVYDDIGIRGIASEDYTDGLNMDGNKIYGKVRTDYLNI